MYRRILCLLVILLPTLSDATISDSSSESEHVLLSVLKKMDKMEKKVNLLERENEDLKSKLDKVTSAFESQIQEFVKEKEHTKKDRRQINVGVNGVAFTAYLDHIEESLGNPQTIVYNQVVLNDGLAYSNNTGIFRAPVPGVYLFSWSVMARRQTDKGGYDVRVDLVHNANQVLTAVAESRTEHEDNQGSNTAILRLAAGDEIWTEHRSGNAETYGNVRDRETSFTGVLLYEVEEATAIVG